MTAKKQVVVIGGGTGTFAVLSGLKAYADAIDITAIVAMTDSGSSTGKLRDELGALPMGDIRMALLALADESHIDNQTLRELFLYRFQKGKEGLAGHNFGNLLLAALSDVAGSELAAIALVSRMLGTKGAVLPVSTESLTLVAEYGDGSRVVGEKDIDVPPAGWVERPITALSVEPQGVLSPGVVDAIASADYIILGPGDLYTSLLATVAVGDLRQRIKDAPGRFLYISNLMSKFGQTTGYPLTRYLDEIERYIGRLPDTVFVNSSPLPPDLVEKYAGTGEYPVEEGEGRSGVTYVRGDLLVEEQVVVVGGDTHKRSLIRHDREKLARAILSHLAILSP